MEREARASIEPLPTRRARHLPQRGRQREKSKSQRRTSSVVRGVPFSTGEKAWERKSEIQRRTSTGTQGGDFLEWMAKWGLEPSPMGKGDRGAVEEVPVQSSASKRGELNVLRLELEEYYPERRGRIWQNRGVIEPHRTRGARHLPQWEGLRRKSKCQRSTSSGTQGFLL